MNRNDISAIITRVPALNEFGIGLFDRGRGLSETEQRAQLHAGQEALRDSDDVCTKVVARLAQNARKRKTISPRWNSYGLKHIVEREIRCYVTNGAFIAAAIFSGFSYKVKRNDPNVWFNISLV